MNSRDDSAPNQTKATPLSSLDVEQAKESLKRLVELKAEQAIREEYRRIRSHPTSGSTDSGEPANDSRRPSARLADWRVVPPERKYWHPINKGFNFSNAKFVCPECGPDYPLRRCVDCGGENSQLGTSMSLPGVFCERCGNGSISWTCTQCQTAFKTMLVFHYDINSVQVRKKKFWE